MLEIENSLLWFHLAVNSVLFTAYMLLLLHSSSK